MSSQYVHYTHSHIHRDIGRSVLITYNNGKYSNNFPIELSGVIDKQVFEAIMEKINNIVAKTVNEVDCVDVGVATGFVTGSIAWICGLGIPYSVLTAAGCGVVGSGITYTVRHEMTMSRIRQFCNLQNVVLLKHTELDSVIPRHIAFRTDPKIGLYIAITEKGNNFGTRLISD